MSSYIIKSELKAPKTEFDTVGSLIIDRLKTWHENIILLNCDLDRRWTGEEVYESCLNFAYHLITECLLAKGDIVCFIIPNSDIHAIAILGVMAAGGVHCSLPPFSTNREIMEIISTIQPSFIVCDSYNYGIAATITAETPSIKKLLIIDETSRTKLNLNCETIEIIIQYDRSFLPLPLSGSLDDKLCLITSSGSTGKPKVIVHTNRSIIAIANALQHEELDNLTRHHIVMSSCFCHICGIRSLYQGIIGGATIALAINDDWMEDFFINIEKFRITSVFLVPSQLNFMVKNNEIANKYDLSSLQNMMVGGSPVSETIYYEGIKKFKKFRHIYGMSEVGFTTSVYLSESKLIKNYTSIGRPVIGIELKGF